MGEIVEVKIDASEPADGDWTVDLLVRGVSGRNYLTGWYGPESPTRDARTADVVDVFVQEGLRGKGYGRLLVETFEHFVRSRGVRVVQTFLTQKEAIPFWEHLGYVREGGRWRKQVESLEAPSQEILESLERAIIKTTEQLQQEFGEEERRADEAFLVHRRQLRCDRLSAIRNLTPEEAREIIPRYLKLHGLSPDTNVVVVIFRCDGRRSREMPVPMYPEWYNTTSPHYYALAAFGEGGSGPGVKLYTGRDVESGSGE